MKSKILLIAFGIVCGLLGAGIVFLTSRPPRGNLILLSPVPTPPLLVVQISGAVKSPGLYELPADSRISDVVRAAGGLTEHANPEGVNLAAFLQDGQSITIPSWTTPSLDAVPQRNSSPLVAQQNSLSGSEALININTATLEELDRLPEVGPVLAQRIIEYRTAEGSFLTIEDILEVPGIGEGIFNQIKAWITVMP